MKILFMSALFALSLTLPPRLYSDVAASDEKGRAAGYSIVERGDHHRVWERVQWTTNEAGEVSGITNSYREITANMHFQKDGNWVESDATVEITPEGASARKGAYQVDFTPNINTAGGAISLVTPEGKLLRSRVLGLSYFDATTGEAVLIAEIKDAMGLLVGDHEIIYENAFDGVDAHVQYICTVAGLEQNIVFRGLLVSPAEFKLNPATTRLQVLTEFFDPPQPKIEVVTMRGADGLGDGALDFGKMKIGAGRAFSVGEENDSKEQVPVAKEWAVVEGRTFLVEEIPFEKADRYLKKLEDKKQRAAAKPRKTGRAETAVAALKTVLPRHRTGRSGGTIQIAKLAKPRQPGFVVDYSILSSQTNYTFQGDTTYYVSGLVNLSGTTTIEGGAVIKFTNSTAAKISMSGSLVCNTGPYRPAVFTSKDDNTVGETITGSTGNPTNYNGGTYLSGGGSAAYKYLRLSYAGVGIYGYPDTGVWHCQFIGCGTAIQSNDADVKLCNVLFSRCGTGVFIGYSGDVLRGEQVTADQLNKFFDSPGSTGYLTNSILTAVTNIGTNVTLSNCTTNSDGSGIYQTVGAGSYYLADNSTNRNGGMTNINATLLADLKQRTTYPPIELTNNFTMDTTLSPQAQRDTDTPDLGYHYDPLDYVFSARTLTNILTLTNGVAIATYGASIASGLSISTAGNVVSEGSASTLNQIVRYNTVQEQSVTNWSGSTVGKSIAISSTTGTQLRARFIFTAWSLLGNNGYHFYGSRQNSVHPFIFKDCQFGGGRFDYYGDGDGAITNCLFERVIFSVADYKSAPNYYLYHNLFRAGSVTVQNYDGGTSTVRDNLFDQATIYQGGTLDHSNNAYISGYNRLTPTNANDVVLTNIPVYQTSYLGRYYYPTNGGLLSLLINAGSRNATNAGLYHFTTTTNQVKETNSTVDIGFHYVAVGTDGLPIDTDGDGVPDYLEDRNGNGTIDSGETSWTDALDLGLRVLITRPKNNSILP